MDTNYITDTIAPATATRKSIGKRAALAAVLSSGLALAGLGLAPGIAQAGPSSCYSEFLQEIYVCGYTPDP